MFSYRYYPLDRADHFVGCEIIEAPHDEAAIRRAETLRTESGMPGFELWQAGRPVAQRPGSTARA